MFDHVTIRVADLGASEDFYRTVLGALGFERTNAGFLEFDDFSVAAASAERPPTRHLHIGFSAPDRERVERFWRAGVDAGHPDDGSPGIRPIYGEDYFGAFLLDPDGNSVEAVHFDGVRPDGYVDHLWMGVRDLDASAAFYETIAPYAGLRAQPRQGRRQFAGEHGTVSLLHDGRPRTEGVHIAFPAPDRATVQAFHATALGAGYTDYGAPGERPQYHPGYYGAFVLDPDGNVIESVFHART